MTSLSRVFEVVVLLALLGAVGFLLYRQAGPLLAVPCEEPLAYHIGTLDERFGISEAALKTALLDAEKVWEEAAGKDLFVFSEGGEIAVQLVYSEQQKNAELGEVISDEQAAYDAKKAEIEALKTLFTKVEEIYERSAREYDQLSAEYHEQVNYWNSQGGAPEKEYEELQEMREDLEDRQQALKKAAEEANEAADALNREVAELNVLARKVNAKVAVYNQSAGDEFDQGDYQEDADGKRINVYEFTDGTDLRRVLAHELGHALGIGHVENPSSVMYSFNAGSSLSLSEEDVAALKSACRLD